MAINPYHRAICALFLVQGSLKVPGLERFLRQMLWPKLPSSARPDARFVCDVLRLTLSAADPMVLGMLHSAFRDLHQVVTTKTNNKYAGDVAAILKTGSPSILVNLEVTPPELPPFIMEVQLYLDPFLSLKKSQHKTYEITRAKIMSDLLEPIYKPKWKRTAASYIEELREI